jgi:chlorobactene glucosyltransferase
MVLARNMISFPTVGSQNQVFDYGTKPSVSILIPARNEEAVIKRCVDSCLLQDYDNYEVLVLNDQSDDQTGEILSSIGLDKGNFRVLTGQGPKPGWLGKPRACEQLAAASTGDILMFIDADVWLQSDAVSSVVASLVDENADAVTVWPQQHFNSYKERVVVPLVYFALMTMLPAVYVKRDPRWMPSFARLYFRTAFAAACGQCLAVKREAYDAIGGHETVKNEIVEDVQLAKSLKRNGFRISMHLGMGKVHCRMYTSDEEIFQGFRKNFFVGFGRNVPFFLSSAMLHALVFVLPYIFLLIGVLSGDFYLASMATASLVVIHIQRLTVDIRNGWNPIYGLFHARGVLWFQRLGITVLTDYFKKRDVQWKGRSILGK